MPMIARPLAGAARRGRWPQKPAALLALCTSVLSLSACAARSARAPGPVGPAAAEAALAADPAIAAALSGLLPAERAVALAVLRGRAEHDAADVARLAASGHSAADIIAALTAPAAAGDRPAAPPGGDRGPPPPPAEYQPVEVAAWSPVRGPAQAKVTLVVFSDFQCPFCARVVPTYRRLQETFGNDLRIVWRNQPLPFHQNAMPAAEAAMAAGAQGKFWQMHDRLFDDPSHLSTDELRKTAEAIGLDLKRYDDDLAAHRYQPQVEGDIQQAARFGVSGTPTSFINGRKIAGAYPFATFAAIITEEIARADALLKGGVAPEQLYAALLAHNPPPPPPEAPPTEDEHAVVALDLPADAPSRGPRGAPVTLVEFSDFQCPYCARAQKAVAAVEEKYRGRLRRVFMHVPLPFHDKAQLAAEAAVAAGAQGKFWAMHDLLFDNQGALDRADLDGYARQAGLDAGRFAAALDHHTYAARVAADLKQAEQVGVDGTPTFFVNGIKLVGAQPAERFEALIDEALKAAPARPAARKPRKH